MKHSDYNRRKNVEHLNKHSEDDHSKHLKTIIHLDLHGSEEVLTSKL